MTSPSTPQRLDDEGLRALGLDPARLPVHVAIIMDGNGRWAIRRGLPRVEGHRAGRAAIRRTVEAAVELGIRVLTLFAFSTENWRRPREEVEALCSLYEQVLWEETPELARNGVCVHVIGDRSEFPPGLQEAIRYAEESTAGNEVLHLVGALNYGGRAEIVQAARALAAAACRGELRPHAIGEEELASRLQTYPLPDPDLIIRTAGEKRLSNFLVWQSAYAELYFTDVLWPEFDRQDLVEALRDYQSRVRRFGGLDAG
ncbi:Ditrans,polycis-undecaprenyl-diphosphate synthase ((2E,6E)-farnesyl-diphosphate specific) [bacterium HR31]|nr:Ditrans,polycis-undecaprenyl-diphosphate synthase ((2E,6E)-farnesyl-diphosphate specific) [bacterium HR31]